MAAEPKPKAAAKKKRRRAAREEFVDYVVEIGLGLLALSQYGETPGRPGVKGDGWQEH